MFDFNVIYNKTEAGIAEVQTRLLGLRSELRRLLMLVHGRTAPSRLASFVPGQPVVDMIAGLETAGLVVTPNSTGDPASAVIAPIAAGIQATPFAREEVPASGVSGVSKPPVTDAQLHAVRSSAARGLCRILGVETHEWLDRVQQPGDSHTLRAAIAEIHQTLEEQFGVATGQHFLDSVRGADDKGRDPAK